MKDATGGRYEVCLIQAADGVAYSYCCVCESLGGLHKGVLSQMQTLRREYGSGWRVVQIKAVTV